MAAAVAALAGVLSALQLSRTTYYSHSLHGNLRSLSPRFRTNCSIRALQLSSAPSKSENRTRKASSSATDDSPSKPWMLRGRTSRSSTAPPPSRFPHSTTDAERQKRRNEKKPTGNGEKGAEEPKYSKAARRFYNERFREPPQRLSKVLASSGVAARRSCEELIFDGKVTVNGSVCRLPQTRVDPGRDIIYVNGNRLPKKLPPKVYLALNKPKGYICSAAGGKELRSVMSLFDDYLNNWDKKNAGQPKPRLFTVGRLDVATTGLIIVTNDGEFAQKLSHPSSNLTKEYIAAIEGEVNKRHLVAISKGVMIDGVHCVPDFVELIANQPDLRRPRIRIVVHEGRNHEVRELVKNAGLELHSLKRIRIAGFRLPADLGLGKHVELKQNDLKALGKS